MQSNLQWTADNVNYNALHRQFINVVQSEPSTWRKIIADDTHIDVAALMGRQPFSVPELQNITNTLKTNVELKDRRHRLRTVKSCFVASDAVEILMNSLGIPREQAIHCISSLVASKYILSGTGSGDFSDGQSFWVLNNESINNLLISDDSNSISGQGTSKSTTAVTTTTKVAIIDTTAPTGKPIQTP